ncbi:MAG: amidase domain-containing protein [Chitinophagales bacterium]
MKWQANYRDPAVKDYDRNAAVQYAHRWAYARNPRYYDFENIGGDCTNFASQCLYAGSGVMNFTKEFGWYYVSVNDRAPAWTGVNELYRFLTTNGTKGPFARVTEMTSIVPGDLVQLRFRSGPTFQHTPVIVAVRQPISPANILVAAHTDDQDNYPLSNYDYIEARFLHILGVYV